MPAKGASSQRRNLASRSACEAMPPGLEPAFAPGRHHWPLAGLGTAGFEPDDPDLTVPAGVLERGARDFPDRLFVARISGDIVSSPAEPMGPPPVVVRGWSAKWRLALAASCLLHAAAALSFLNLESEVVLIEGAELSGIAFHGNASEDQMSAGELSRTSEPAVEVTMITMMEARPVDTTEAEMSPADEIAEAVDIVEMEGPVVERVQPERVAVARPVAGSDAVPAETVTAQAASAMPPEPAEPVEHDSPAVCARRRARAGDSRDRSVRMGRGRPGPKQGDRTPPGRTGRSCRARCAGGGGNRPCTKRRKRRADRAGTARQQA